MRPGFPGPPNRDRRRVHVMWAAVAIAVGLSGSLLRPGTNDAVPAVNPRPVIVLMDSPLPDRVYDPRTLAAGGTNADDVPNTEQCREDFRVAPQRNRGVGWGSDGLCRSSSRR
jgi:hypothetical protein